MSPVRQLLLFGLAEGDPLIGLIEGRRSAGRRLLGNSFSSYATGPKTR
jgi:hypothetical protein